jgi:tryptophan halogenase
MNQPSTSHVPGRALVGSVLVVGGTAAGWMTACYLKSAFPGLALRVLDVPDATRVELPQGTGPDFQRSFFDVLGISEDEWMRQCGASFRVATKHVNWRTPRALTPDDYYYQLFEPIPDCDNLPLAHYWVHNHLNGDSQAMEYACHKEPKVLDVKLAPRFRDGSRAMRYGWHVDAEQLSSFLRRTAAGLGIERVAEQLGRVELTAGGAIAAVHTQSGSRLDADLFIDCSGARRLLFNALQVPFIDMSEYLACDRIVSATFVNDDATEGVDPYTSAIALNAGWAWKIPMLGRFGTGYVYSSKFAGADEAARELCALWQVEYGGQSLRQSRLRAGRNQSSWVENCVSIGQAAGCVEPLEASNVDLTCAALAQLAQYFPDRSFAQVLRERFNLAMARELEQARDLTQLHYLASPRQDSAFWRESRGGLRLSHRAQHSFDSYGLELPAGYHVLAGMGLVSERLPPFVRYRRESRDKAQQMFERIRQSSDQLYARLPTNYELLRRLHAG